MLNGPFPPWPSFTEAEAQAVKDVLLSNRVNYWTGERCRQFEQAFAQQFDSKFAIALANGTVALDLALKALNIGPGDEVIVTPRTFIASVSAVVNAGATPVFADVGHDCGNLTPHTIAERITERTRAIVVVHLGGWPADMPSIMALAAENGLKVIEDCAQAHGARLDGRSVGTFGHIGAWSFCQDKIMTTGGEGGMVTTNDEGLWSRMWSYKDHGKSYNAVYRREHPPGFRWLHESFGTNWRMTEMQAAIGLIQLEYLPEWHKRRLKYANRIWDTARSVAWLRVPTIPEGSEHAAYKCYVYLRPEKLPDGWNREKMMQFISDKGVPVFSGSCSEVYLEKAFDDAYRPSERLPVARELGDTSMMFLVHPTLTEQDIDRTCDAIKELANVIK